VRQAYPSFIADAGFSGRVRAVLPDRGPDYHQDYHAAVPASHESRALAALEEEREQRVWLQALRAQRERDGLQAQVCFRAWRELRALAAPQAWVLPQALVSAPA
jgi:hypothetical protein